MFNLATQFGGGKTHALTLLYHLATNGRKAEKWTGVEHLLGKAGVDQVPQAAVATFVGTEFDSITGRGGDDGTPHRKTPWGEIAWQLGQQDSFAAVAEHERTLTAPAGDVIRKMLWLNPSSVEVTVANGVVTLAGEVSSEADAELLPTFTRKVPGVVEVSSSLTHSPS